MAKEGKCGISLFSEGFLLNGVYTSLTATAADALICESKLDIKAATTAATRNAKIASELMSAKKINLVMDNWFLREAGSKSSTPFHHDISYFDIEGTMCVLWLPLQSTGKDEGVAWVKGSHLWGKLFLRVLFKDGHNVEGKECIINGKSMNCHLIF